MERIKGGTTRKEEQKRPAEVAASGCRGYTLRQLLHLNLNPIELEFIVALLGQGDIMKVLWSKVAEEHQLIC